MIFQVECRIVMKSLTSCPITLLQVHLWDLVLIVQIPMLLPYARAFSNPFLPLPPQTFCLMVEWKGDQKLALTKRQKWYVIYRPTRCLKFTEKVSFNIACGQTVLPDRSLSIGQKLAEITKLETLQSDILSNFQTMC